MKHLRSITTRQPARADVVQDVICTVILGLSSLLGFIGGSAPIVSFLEDKCILPTPNDDGDNTA